MANVQQVLAQAVSTLGSQLEAQLDNEIYRLDHLNEEDIASIRQKRMQELRKRQEKSKEWLAKGHGEYTEIFSEQEFFKAMKVGRGAGLCACTGCRWAAAHAGPPAGRRARSA